MEWNGHRFITRGGLLQCACGASVPPAWKPNVRDGCDCLLCRPCPKARSRPIAQRAR